ncbi:MAG TPA: TetR/AcrR family transcriptional regulator [Solirubrobacterales bacterium]|nr:TetR/AcrR family transcriptional regulator [Solirubrobacterales bacterium]
MRVNINAISNLVATAGKTRTYHSPRRQEEAEATRRAILDAARRLFERDGYAATSMAAIAAEARVSNKTVYLAFETKSALLRALWNLLLRGDEDETPVAQRRWYREVIEEPDPVRKLRMNARNSRGAKGRMGAMLKVIRSAAPADPDIAGLWERIQSEYWSNQEAIVKSIGPRGLASGLDVRRATDILWTLNHPDVWLLLVDQRGWTPKRYEKWCAETACSELLG